MRRNQLTFLVIILLAVGIIVAGTLIGALNTLLEERTTSDSSGSESEPVPEGAVGIVVQSSNTKERWLEGMAQQYNASAPTLADGTPIVVQVQHTGSPLEPELQPTLWSPSNALWVEEKNSEWRDLYSKPLVSEATCPATINQPVGIAMWRPMAEALGWPDADIRWSQITDLAVNPEGWAALGHPEWGVFRYGHGHPEFSNSGRLSVVAQIYAAKGNNDPLTYDEIWSEETQAALRPIQLAIAHYGRRDTFLLDRMVERGASYLHAVTNYEGNVIRWNQEFGAQLQFPLVMLYPVDGTFWEEHPMCFLDGAEWVTAQQAEAARLFREFITARPQQEQLIPTGLRPALPGIALDGPTSPFTPENGVLPSITQASMPLLPYPSAELMPNVVDMWYQIKKPATVALVIDVSGSMYGDPLKGAVAGAQRFIDEMQPQDQVYIYIFNDQVTPLSPSGAVGDVREELKQRVGGLIADGGTSLYLAVITGLDALESLQAVDLENDQARTYSLVVLSDGADSTGAATESQLLARLPDGTESDQVHIYTIAYGAETNEEVLTRMANRTNGQFFTSSAQDIEEIYFRISSEF
jgi:Ca-activated chloride channel family protein